MSDHENGHVPEHDGPPNLDAVSSTQHIEAATGDENALHLEEQNERTPKFTLPTDLEYVATHSIPATVGATSLGDATGAPTPTMHPLTEIRMHAQSLLAAIEKQETNTTTQLVKLNIQQAVVHLEALFEGAR